MCYGTRLEKLYKVTISKVVFFFLLHHTPHFPTIILLSTGITLVFERCSAPLRQTDLCLSRCQHEFVASVRSSACLLIGWPKVACLVIGWPKRCPYSRTWGPFPWRPHAQLPQSWSPLHFSPPSYSHGLFRYFLNA